LICESCGQTSLPNARFCFSCGHELPAPEEEAPLLLTCDSCGRQSAPGANYCSGCGEPLGASDLPDDQSPGEGYDPNKRTACSDGMCIGIIGPDGKCVECGKPYNGPPRLDGGG
jgi:uncharacterized OB-fold protein